MLYIPGSFEESNKGELHKFIRQHNFSTMISHSGEVHISHLPLLLLPDRGPFGTLVGHVARANRHWQDFDGQRNAVCVFHGPHSYISPTWYKDRPAVPTWNYAVVHATGTPRLLESKEELAGSLDQLVEHVEPSLLLPDSDGYLPQSLKEAMLDQIVGFQIEIKVLRGKYKLGQNRSLEDQTGVMKALAREGGSPMTLLEFMKDRRS